MAEENTPITFAEAIAQRKIEDPHKQLSQQDKERLAEDGTPFTITEISYGDDDKYGPFFQCTITVDGQEKTFRLTHNANRDAMMEQLASLVAVQPVSGVRLVAYPGGFGNKYITIEPVS